MSSQDEIKDIMSETEEIIEELEREETDVERIKDAIKEDMTRLQFTKDKQEKGTTLMRNLILQMKSQKSKLEDDTAKLKDGTGRYDLDEWQKMAESYKQTCFDNALHGVMAMDPDESLDRLRNMSSDHMAALLDVERDHLACRLRATKLTLQLTEDNQDKLRSDIGSKDSTIESNRQEILRLVKDKEDLKKRISKLEEDEEMSISAYNMAVSRRKAAERKAKDASNDIKELNAKLSRKESEVADLTDTIKQLEDASSRKNDTISGTRDELQTEKASHEGTRGRLDRAQHKIAKLEGEADKRSASLAAANNTIKRRNGDILSMDAELTKMQGESARKDRLLKDKEEELEQLRAEVAWKDALLADKKDELKQSRKDSSEKDVLLAVKENEPEQTRDELVKKDTLLADKNNELKKSREESSEKDVLLTQKEDELKQLKESSSKKDTLLADKEDELKHSKEESSKKDTLLAQKDANLQQEIDRTTQTYTRFLQRDSDLRQANDEIQQLKKESIRKDAEIAQKVAELTDIQGECSRGASLLAQKETELQQVTRTKDTELKEVNEECSRKDTDLAQTRLALGHHKDEVQRKTINLARLLMGQEHKDQEINSWLPLVNSSQFPMALPSLAISSNHWWTVAPLRKQHTRPIGMLESLGLLYGEVIAKKWADDGSRALQIIIHCLEVAEVAPIAMVMELTRCLLTSIPQGDDVETFGFIFGTSQVVSLLRLRWPETNGLAEIEARCQQTLDRSRPDLQLIHDLVAGIGCGSQVTSAFIDNEELPHAISSIPHKYCPEQETLLLAPPTDKSCVWALDLHHHTIWLVNKSIGDFVDDDRNYRLERPGGGEHIMVPATKVEDLDFIFRYLD
ncbi:hypothetical protein O1611_g2169 [Lasiodiplodia mahajangana]|uniref:Uncharacterized protein n=1 Tax=Lasiodiplodia mahajangana TaxID=1108764 RepID=A0ACC2JV89_9PEZI|nr:hypothetical protein O1611_g2169 [Lasiodiplodia mahajangana]